MAQNGVEKTYKCKCLNHLKQDILNEVSENGIDFNNLPVLDDANLLNNDSEILVKLENNIYKVSLLQLLHYIHRNDILDNLPAGNYTLWYEDENGNIINNFDQLGNINITT